MQEDEPDCWQPLAVLALLIAAQAGEKREKQAERSRVGMRYVPPTLPAQKRGLAKPPILKNSARNRVNRRE